MKQLMPRTQHKVGRFIGYEIEVCVFQHRYAQKKSTHQAVNALYSQGRGRGKASFYRRRRPILSTLIDELYSFLLKSQFGVLLREVLLALDINRDTYERHSVR